MMRVGSALNNFYAKRFAHTIEVIMIEETQHTHTLVRTNDIFSEIDLTLGDGTKLAVKVEPRDLYEVSRGIFGFLKRIRTGEKDHYLLIVDSEGNPIKEVAPKISGKVLRVARDWKGLGKAIHDSFGGRFQIPRTALVVAVGVGVVVIVFLVWRGFIPTPTSWGIGS